MDCGFFIYSPEKEIKTGYKLFGQKSPMLISAHIKCIHIYRLILWAAPNDDVMWPIRNGALIKYENIKSRKGVENSSTFVFQMQVKRPLDKIKIVGISKSMNNYVVFWFSFALKLRYFLILFKFCELLKSGANSWHIRKKIIKETSKKNSTKK